MKTSGEPFNPLRGTGLKPRVLWLAAVWHNGVKQIVNGTFRWPAGRAAHRAEMLKQRKEATKVRLKAAKDS